MHRTRLGSLHLIPLFVALVLGVLAAFTPAVAGDNPTWEGEPTDPEDALFIVETYEIDLSQHGLSDTAPRDDSWFTALLDLLRALGILAPEGDGS